MCFIIFSKASSWVLPCKQRYHCSAIWFSYNLSVVFYGFAFIQFYIALHTLYSLSVCFSDWVKKVFAMIHCCVNKASFGQLWVRCSAITMNGWVFYLLLTIYLYYIFFYPGNNFHLFELFFQAPHILHWL